MGTLGPAVVLVTIAYGAGQSTAFSWPTDPFSVVGATGTTTALVFNVGLVLAGCCLLAFAPVLVRRLSRAVGLLYGLVGLSFAGAGAFPMGDGLHEVFGAGAMFGTWVLLWVAGVVDWRAGRRRAGGVAVALGCGVLAVWLPYDLGLTWAQLGLAAELATFLAFAAWSCWMAVRLWDFGPDLHQTGSGTHPS